MTIARPSGNSSLGHLANLVFSCLGILPIFTQFNYQRESLAFADISESGLTPFKGRHFGVPHRTIYNKSSASAGT